MGLLERFIAPVMRTKKFSEEEWLRISRENHFICPYCDREFKVEDAATVEFKSQQGRKKVNIKYRCCQECYEKDLHHIGRNCLNSALLAAVFAIVLPSLFRWEHWIIIGLLLFVGLFVLFLLLISFYRIIKWRTNVIIKAFAYPNTLISEKSDIEDEPSQQTV